MPEDRDTQLESLFAAEEVAIQDDGFTRAVMAGTRRTPYVRRAALYGAGMAGFGVAAGSLSELAQRFPGLSSWAEQARTEVTLDATAIDLQSAIANAGVSPLVIAVLLFGVTISLAAVVFQGR